MDRPQRARTMPEPSGSTEQSEEKPSSSSVRPWEVPWRASDLFWGIAPFAVVLVWLRAFGDGMDRWAVMTWWVLQGVWLIVWPCLMRRRRAAELVGSERGHGRARRERSSWKRRLAWGGGAGLGAAGLLFALQTVMPESANDQRGLPDAEAAGTVAGVLLLAWMVVLGPITEELYFRGFLLHALARRAPGWLAIGVQAALFAAVHPYGWVGLANVFGVGVLLGALARVGGGLIMPMTAHVTINATLIAVALFATSPTVGGGWMGIRGEMVDRDNGRQLLISEVVPSSPATKCGLEVGDALYTIDGYGMPSTFGDFAWYIRSREAGSRAQLTFLRGDGYFATEIVLGEAPRGPPR